MSSPVRPYPELSVPAVVFGTLQGVVMTASFVYIALKLGFGLAGSTVAAIMGFVVLRGILRRRSIVENNVNQTVASGINTASSGVVFTLPALMLLSVDDPTLANIPVWPLCFAAVAGSLMGVVLIIPLRKQMVEFDRLRFPSGTAVATLLKSPGEGLAQGKLLVAGGLIAAVLTLFVNLGFVGEEVDLGGMVGLPAWAPIALYVSAANIGAGLLSGRGGLPFLAGGVLAYSVIAPAAVVMGWVPAPDLPPAQLEGFYAAETYGSMLRPLGIGLLIGGALAGVISAAPAVIGAMKSLRAAAALAAESGASAEEVDPKWVGGGAVLAFILLFVAAWLATPELGLPTAFLVALVGSLWLGLAGIIVAQATGQTDISPLSGLALIAVTLMYFLTQGNVTASILIGVAVCIATSQCADMMQDLKTGHMVGSVPKEQQVAQLMVTWIGPFIAIGVLMLLWSSGPMDAAGNPTPGFGPDSVACIEGTGQCLSAPQADVLRGIIEALRDQDAAVDKYLAGGTIGGVLSLFPIGGISVLVGLAMYLPFSITLAYGIGCLVSMGLERGYGPAFIGRKLVPFAAGLIVGEALTALIWNGFVLLETTEVVPWRVATHDWWTHFFGEPAIVEAVAEPQSMPVLVIALVVGALAAIGAAVVAYRRSGIGIVLLSVGVIAASLYGARNGAAFSDYRAELSSGAETTMTLPGPNQRLTEWFATGGLGWGAGIVLIVLGAGLARRRQAAEATAPTEDGSVADLGVGLKEVLARTDAIAKQIAELPMDADAPEARDALDAIAFDVLTPLVDARARFVARHGLGVFTNYFSPFSAGERQLARAWSALTDGHSVVARESLASAHRSFTQALEAWDQAEAA